MKNRLKTRLLAAAVALAAANVAFASSHREAPFITKLPQNDNTDVYVFKSYEPGRSDFVTLIANYLPLQDAYGGPNYFELDTSSLYEINIDNDGDAKEEITFAFRFQRDFTPIEIPVGDEKVAIPLINAGPITGFDPPREILNRKETYTVNIVRRGNSQGYRRALTNTSDSSKTFIKPVDNIGNKSIPDYETYANAHIYTVNIPGCDVPGSKLFVGQRKEGFQVNLGEIFDLVNLSAGVVTGARDGQNSATAFNNVTTLALEVPIACLTNSDEPVIGVWATSSVSPNDLRQMTTAAPRDDGRYRQISRLSSPLVNELVIGLPDKDKFNSSEPRNDGQFATYVTNPTLPELLEILFGSAGVKAPDVFPRADLVAAFLTGVPGVNQPANVVPSEMLRLNTGLPATLQASQNSLGALQCFVDGVLTLTNTGCDPAGFPNGRRPGDDVVDIELRVAMGVLLPSGPGKPASADLPYTDGAIVNADQFKPGFPYLQTPFPGSPNGQNGVPEDPL